MSLLDPHMLVHLVVRWLDLAAMVTLLGGVVFDAFVMTPALRQMALAPTVRESVMRSRRRLQARLLGWSLGLLVVIQFVDIVLRIQMMSRQSLAAVTGIMVPAIMGTHIGKVWLGKMAVLVWLAALWWLAHRSRRGLSGELTWHPTALMGSASIFCLMIALAGHAADKGNVSPAVAADWFHVMAVAAWVGGLVSLRVLLPSVSASLDEQTSARLFVRAMARFSTVAGWSLGILVVTGGYNIWLHIPSWTGLSSTYGLALLVKLAFVAPMIGLGALGRYHILPELHALTGERFHAGLLVRPATWIVTTAHRLINHTAPSLIADSVSTVRSRGLRFIALECMLAAGVLVATAVLTQSMPPHFTGFENTEATPEMGEMPGM